MVTLNIFLIAIEKIWLAVIPRKPTAQKDPVFIIGHPRSGTTLLHETMASDTQFCAPKLYEVLFPNYMLTSGKILKAFISPFIPSKRPQDNVTIGLNKPQEEEFALAAMGGPSFMNGFYYPRKFKENYAESVSFVSDRNKSRWKNKFQYFANKLEIQHHDKKLLFKSPANMGRIETILEMYPNAKFIHIHRHPENTIQSTEGLFENVLPQVSFQKINGQQMDENMFWMYKRLFKDFWEQKEAIPKNNFYEIRFEDLLADFENTINKCYQYFGFKATKKDVKRWKKIHKTNQQYKMNQHKSLTKDQVTWLQEETKKMRDTYNYE